MLMEMFFCNLCQKPFTHEASRNRHVSYCRRSRNRPRVRHQSCQACSAAKARCSFEPSCSRCINKGLECVYDDRIGRVNASVIPAATRTKPVSPPAPADWSTPTPLHRSEVQNNSLELAADELPWDISLDLLQMSHSSSTVAPVSNTVSAPTITNTTSYVSELSRMPDTPAMTTLEKIYSTGQERSDKPGYPSTITASPTVTALEMSGFLTPLPMSGPAAQCNANYIIQMLRPFPQLMVQKATFPPFIHPFYYKTPTDSLSPVLQTPLANCMSIAQMFVPRTQETKPFVWKSIQAEQRRLLSEMETYSKEELLAAIQAYIIYLIMRMVDDTPRNSEHDLHMLLSFQILCEQFRKLCSQPFALDEQANPTDTWQDWIFSESRRRVACIWFIISRVICVKTGIPCDTTEVYHDIPLPSGHSLWTANCSEAWEVEYRSSQINHRRPRLVYFGDLLEAQRSPGDAPNSQKLDLWHTDADQLGIMLMLATAMV